MAWAVAVGGQGLLDSSHGNKFVVMQDGVHNGVRATRARELFGQGWVKDNGYWVSNTRWKTAPIFKRVQSPDNGWYTVPTHRGGLTSIRAASMEEAIEKVGRQEDMEHERAAMKVNDRRRVFQTPSFDPQPKKAQGQGQAQKPQSRSVREVGSHVKGSGAEHRNDSSQRCVEEDEGRYET